MSEYLDLRDDPRAVAQAVRLWKSGCYGTALTFAEARRLVALRLLVVQGAYLDDRTPAESTEGGM